jgi:hypothetical protein
VINGNSPNFPNLLQFLTHIGKKPARGNAFPGIPFTPMGIRYMDPTIVKSRLMSAKPTLSNKKCIDVLADPVIPRKRDQRVRISGVEEHSDYNRQWIDTGLVTPEEGGLNLGTRKDEVSGTYVGPSKARIWAEKFLYGPVNQYVIIGLRSKKTGRVFRQLAGRR